LRVNTAAEKKERRKCTLSGLITELKSNFPRHLKRVEGNKRELKVELRV